VKLYVANLPSSYTFDEYSMLFAVFSQFTYVYASYLYFLKTGVFTLHSDTTGKILKLKYKKTSRSFPSTAFPVHDSVSILPLDTILSAANSDAQYTYIALLIFYLSKLYRIYAKRGD
jgi:hypothetical protein